jgi:uncharacterized protein (DUF885 family)
MAHLNACIKTQMRPGATRASLLAFRAARRSLPGMREIIAGLVGCACAMSALASEPGVRRFAADLGTLYHFCDTELSVEQMGRFERFTASRLEDLAHVDFAVLNRQDQVDHILMRNKLQMAQLQLGRSRQDLESDRRYLPFLETILALDRDRRQAQPLDDAQAARDVAALVDQIKEARELAEKKQAAGEGQQSEDAGEDAGEPGTDEKKKGCGYALSKSDALRVAKRVKTCQQRLGTWYKHYAAFRPQFEWWVKKPRAAADKSLAEYEKLLREKVAGAKKGDGPLIGRPVGKERLEELIAGEFIPYSAEELIAIGEREFAWCVAEAKKAAKAMGFDDRLKALEKVKNAYVDPGEQDQLVARYARESIAFIERHEVVTIPALCRELWNVDMIDANVQQRIPYAMYGGNRVMVAYATNGMEHDKKTMAMRGNNLHATRIVVAHEVIPGHHLQHFMAARYRSDRSVFKTPFCFEGWALYWEMRLWDLGFARGPEDRVGMLFWRMHRCARIIVSLRFHLGLMTPDEMVDFLVDEVGHEEAQARSEVRRYIGPGSGPLYQAAYMLGGLQFSRLHKQFVPARMAEREFHDRLLRLGTIPVDLIRLSLDEAVPLSPDYQGTWRFYDE